MFNEGLKHKLSAYFKQKLGCEDYKAGWMKGNCALCYKELKFGVNISANRTNCFVCGEHPKPIALVMQLEGFTTRNEVYHYLKTFEDATYLEPKFEEYKKRKVILPEGFRLISLGKSRFSDLARNYLVNRGYKIRELTLRGIGYCTTEKYSGYIIFPFYQKGKLIYYTTRKFVGAGPKFKNPSVEDFGIGKSSIIYNIDALAIYDTINIVESITNSLTLGNNTIAIDGKVISNYQKSCVLRSPVKNVRIILDRDAYGYALKMGLDLVHHKKVKVIDMPDDNDINDIGRTESRKLIRAINWQSYRDIYRYHLNYEERA